MCLQGTRRIFVSLRLYEAGSRRVKSRETPHVMCRASFRKAAITFTVFSAIQRNNSLQLVKMTRVFIGRLAMSARESDVEKFLRGYGKVRDISLKRGYGFVVRYQCASIS